MKVLVVIGSQISGFPPVRNLVEILLRNGHTVTLMGRDRTGVYFEVNDRFKFVKIPEYDGIPSIIRYLKKIQFMREYVVEAMREHDVLWTTTDATVRDLGDLVLNYRHIMQLMELIQDIPRFPGQTFWGLNIQKYAQKAFKVVVPEYNRAHIQKAWWSLPKLPSILPNKMTQPNFEEIKIPSDIEDVLTKTKEEKRKIILYQGVFQEDRDIDKFTEAIGKLKNEYVLYLMGNETKYKKLLCSMDDSIVNIPFIKPPYHLIITKQAYIGLLPYKAGNHSHYDKLNALYCAPNKIFEYAAYGVPMIGTDVPGLHVPFSEYGIGYICEPYTVENVINKVNQIKANYHEMSLRCKVFYNEINMDEIISSILYN